MSYIGVQPTAGQYRKLDNISSGFNGSTTSFTTSVSGTNVTAGTAQQLLVSLGGVIQQPDTDYTVSTNTITFTTAPTSGLTFFAVLMGDALNTVTTSDGAITTAKLAGSLSVGLAAGTASAPSLYFTGDTNTGIYSLGSDQVAISTGGTGRLFVDSSGRVGIGTSTPSSWTNASPALVIGNSNTTAYSATSFAASPNLVLAGGSTSGTYNAIRFTGTGANEVSFGVVQEAGGAGAFVFQGYNGSAYSERLRIDSNGRVGIGTTSPTNKFVVASSGVGYEIDQSSIGNTNLLLSYDRGASAYRAVANYYGGTYSWNDSGNERARIDSSGRLLVGTSSYSGNGKVAVAGNTGGNAGALDICWAGSRPTTAGTDIGYIRWYSADNSSSNAHYASIYATSDGASSSGSDIPGRLVFATTADGASSPTERQRISADGYNRMFAANNTLAVLTAQGAGTSFPTIEANYSATGIGINDGTVSFRVWSNGNVVNTNNSYGAISDVKLKENIVDASSQWDDLKALQVRNYNFKEGQTHTQIGLVAQEAELVSPGLVTESPDRDKDGNDLGTVTKSVNYSVLYMKAVKALQEAMERIEQLETEMAEVKAQLS